MKRGTVPLLLLAAAGCHPSAEIPADLGTRMQPTFRSIQDRVFTPYCAVRGCHVGSGGEALLNLEAGVAWRSLVDRPSTQMPDLSRVEPGAPERSYLVLKLAEGSAIVGEPMPRRNQRLPEPAIDVIRAWISRGAPVD
jgi:hypothetical protein